MRITDDQRRRLLVHRQLTLTGCTVLEATDRLVALHATEASSVYLALLARMRGLTIDDVRVELETGDLVRVLAMRRTLFVVRRELVPTVYAAASIGVGRTLRARMLKQLATIPTDPPVTDPQAFLVGAAGDVLAALAQGPLEGAGIARAVPALRTAFLPTTDKKWDVRRSLTSPVLAMLSAEGEILRGQPAGPWTSTRHRWERATDRFPGGIPVLDEAAARADLARAWLVAFGPATEADLAWWTGWSLGHARAAIAALETRPVELSAGDGFILAESDLDAPPAEGHVALLPSLDPTTMGWKHRDWYLGPHRPHLFDAVGNAGPTIWAEGRIVGAWAVRDGGEVVYRLLEDVGSDTRSAVDAEAARIAALIDGATFRASFPNALHRELRR